jgi:hypothetical protein
LWKLDDGPGAKQGHDKAFPVHNLENGLTQDDLLPMPGD